MSRSSRIPLESRVERGDDRGVVMGQMDFFDLSKRYAGLDAKADPLVKLNAIVPWADFRSRRL